MEENQLFDIWSEGFQTEGMSKPSPARRLGQTQAETFHEACLLFFADHPMTMHFDASKLTVWGCRLFPTEEEARESFG